MIMIQDVIDHMDVLIIRRSMKNMKNQKKLKFLGTGSCFNIKAGNNCAYYYNKDKGQLLLLDCGEDVFSKAVMKFKNLKKVVIIITHFHSDHMGSLPSFIYYCKIAFNIKPIVIYPNDSICKLLENMGVSRDLYIHKKRAIFIDDVVNIEHYSSLESYGYVLKFGKRKIYYSGDSKRLPIDILEK